MDARHITDALARVFNEDQVRIVFWNDPQAEFIESLPEIALEGVEVLRLDEIAVLEAKVRIEQDDPEGRFLLYSPSEEPDFENDWLLDMRLYGGSFRADRASIIYQELGLVTQSLRPHLSKRRKFFDNKMRLQQLKLLLFPEDSELDLDRKMLGVIGKADQPELYNIVRSLFHSVAEAEPLNFEAAPPAWVQIERLELDEPFWKMVETEFGYSEDSPALQNLLIRLLVSDFARQVEQELPPALQQHLLNPSGTGNAAVCLAQWRDSSSKSSSYNVLAEQIGELLDIADHLQGLEVESVWNVSTFPDVEKHIVMELLGRLEGADAPIDPDYFRSIATQRQSGHWVSNSSVPEDQRRTRYAVYESIAVAAQLLNLHQEHETGFEFTDPESMYRGYEDVLFRFDQLYRHFCRNADVASRKGWGMLQPLCEKIEAVYCNGYLARLALSWGKFVDTELIEEWAIPEVPHQYQFFFRHVGAKLKEADNRRVFVIISDALRYEVAEELTGSLNALYRLQADLSSQLGVLPSYTALGMASLLPHTKLEYTEKGGILADGKPTDSFEERHELLSAAGGMAIKAEQLLKLGKVEGRKSIAGRRFVYIYHNEIDARGDHAATEEDVFEAAEKTIREMTDLVKHVVNSLNGNHVFITTDHGFLFTETTPGDPEKSKLEDRPAGTVIAKKRYLLGHHLPPHMNVWRGETAVTSKAEGGMQFWIPKGNNRFHFTGGARFVHGGAMLQEIVVPVIEVKHLKSKGSREKTRSRQVTVQVLGRNHKITAAKHRFKILQMEPVSERARSITLKIAVYEEDQPVTTIESMTFDSTSSDFDQRQKSVILTLQDRKYDKNVRYRLVLRDAVTDIEQEGLDVTIDRAIIDDFDF